jgi:hypothetical protein
MPQPMYAHKVNKIGAHKLIFVSQQAEDATMALATTQVDAACTSCLKSCMHTQLHDGGTHTWGVD